MTLSPEELTAAVAELRARVAALEHTPARPRPRLAGTDLIPALRELVPEGDGIVLYAGTGPRAEGEVAWQLGRRWKDVLAADRARGARALAALASPARLDIVAELLQAPLGRQELLDRLDQSTAGQLNHHLRELVSAGLVEQPSRGLYVVPARHVVPVLALLSSAIDLAGGAAEEEPQQTSG